MSIQSNLDDRQRLVSKGAVTCLSFVTSIFLCLMVMMCSDPSTKGEYRPYCKGDCKNGRGTQYTFVFDQEYPVDYDGIFENGYLKGDATITWGNGVVYKGNVRWNYREGNGIRTAPGQTVLNGRWLDNHIVCLQGDCSEDSGEIVYIDIDAISMFVPAPDQQNNPYFIQWANWDRYIGHFQAGKLYGCGAVVREGKVDWGLWNDNRLVKNRADECREELKEVIANDTGERFIRCYPSEGCIDEKQ